MHKKLLVLMIGIIALFHSVTYSSDSETELLFGGNRRKLVWHDTSISANNTFMLSATGASVILLKNFFTNNSTSCEEKVHLFASMTVALGANMFTTATLKTFGFLAFSRGWKRIGNFFSGACDDQQDKNPNFKCMSPFLGMVAGALTGLYYYSRAH